MLEIGVRLCRPTSTLLEVFKLQKNVRDGIQRIFAHGQMISQQHVVSMQLDRSTSGNPFSREGRFISGYDAVLQDIQDSFDKARRDRRASC